MHEGGWARNGFNGLGRARLGRVIMVHPAKELSEPFSRFTLLRLASSGRVIVLLVGTKGTLWGERGEKRAGRTCLFRLFSLVDGWAQFVGRGRRVNAFVEEDRRDLLHLMLDPTRTER